MSRVPLSLATAAALLVCLPALAVPVLAQEAGGLPISASAHGGPVGLARPLPQAQTLITAEDVQAALSPSDHQALNQDLISRLRGDPGFLAGFQFGQPLALSRPPAVGEGRRESHHHHHHHQQSDHSVGSDPAGAVDQASDGGTAKR